MTKKGLVAVTACLCLGGCVPPPNGGKVTGTELRDLFASKNQTEIQSGEVIKNKVSTQTPQAKLSVDEVVKQIQNGTDIKTVVNQNFSTLYGKSAVPIRDEFGNTSMMDTCSVVYVYNNTNKKEVYYYYSSALIKKGYYPKAGSSSDRAMQEAVLSGMAEGTLKRMVMSGEIPSTVNFTGVELEYLGRDFKGSYSSQDIMLKIMRYMYLGSSQTTSDRNSLVSAFLLTKTNEPGLNNSCQSMWGHWGLSKYIITSKNPTALKFLGALMSSDDARATNVLMSDPETKDIFIAMRESL